MARDQLLELAKEFPMQYLFSTQITDHRGRIVAVVGSLEDDIDGHIIRHMFQGMVMSAGILDAVMERLVERYGLSPEGLANHLVLLR